jgi:integrase
LAWNMEAASRGALAVAGSVTVGEYVASWLVMVAAHRLRASTLEGYRTYTERFIVPYLGDRPLAALSPKDIRYWLDRLALECQCCRQGFDAKRAPAKQRCCALGACCRKVPASATVAYTHGILKTALADAVREEQLTRNVAKLAPAPPIRSAPINPWTAGEAQVFLAHARDRERLAVTFELALRTGLRAGELCALSWNDIDLDKNVLTVRHSLRRHVDGAGLTLTEPKTRAGRRRIPLPPGCADLLRGHRAHQLECKAELGERWTDSGLVVTSLIGTPMDPRNLSRYFQDAVRRSGVRKIRFHDMRHTCATLLLESGADLTVIKDLLGHSKIQITADVYTHVRLKLVRGAFDAMSHMLDAPHPDSGEGVDDLPQAA